MEVAQPMEESLAEPLCPTDLLEAISTHVHARSPRQKYDALLSPHVPIRQHSPRSPRKSSRSYDKPKRIHSRACLSPATRAAPRRQRVGSYSIGGCCRAYDERVQPLPPRTARSWYSSRQRLCREGKCGIVSSGTVVRWHVGPDRQQLGTVRTTGEAKYVKMLHWLRKHGKGESLEVDLVWLRLLRTWFSAVCIENCVAVDSVQRILTSVGIKTEPEALVRSLETHDLTVSGTFFRFVEFILDIDKNGVSRILAAQRLPDMNVWPPPYCPRVSQ